MRTASGLTWGLQLLGLERRGIRCSGSSPSLDTDWCGKGSCVGQGAERSTAGSYRRDTLPGSFLGRMGEAEEIKSGYVGEHEHPCSVHATCIISDCQDNHLR
jgi:hypothetical protein